MTAPDAPSKASVLLVDDEDAFRNVLQEELLRKGYSTRGAKDGTQALRALSRERTHVVLLDICLNHDDGVDVLDRIRRDHPWTRVIMLTGNPTVDTALGSMKRGAYDYLTKPCRLEELCLIIDKAFNESQLQRDNDVLRSQLLRALPGSPFIGKDLKILEVIENARKAATSDLPVLICGETGTGKEIVARMVHASSRRAPQPFLAVNCGAFQESLLQSELFGHEKGAFTDAIRDKPGLVELAHGGSLFLDEVGEAPPAVQTALLRFLDSGEFRRVGATATLHSEARILSATNQDLAKAIQDLRFRQDLYFRLHVVTIDIPPLRERKGDIPLLAAHFLEKRAGILKRGLRLSNDALDAMMAYRWPGNVRELENVVERAAILTDGDLIRGPEIASFLKPITDDLSAAGTSLVEIERHHILKVMESCAGNKSRAARLLGIDNKTLYNKLRQYGSATRPSNVAPADG